MRAIPSWQGIAARRVVAAVAFGLAVTAAAAQAQPVAPVSLGGAETFATLGRTGVTSTGASTFAGDVGVGPGGTLTGVTAAMVTGGSLHDGDAVAAQALRDARAAWAALAGRTCLPANQNPVLNGASLAPGVYCFNADAVIAPGATLTLTGAGPWIFQVAGALTIGDGASIVAPIAPPATCAGSEVYWQVGDQDTATAVTPVTVGAGATVVGTIVAEGDVTLGSAAELDGQVLSVGAVTGATGESVSATAAAATACGNGQPLPLAPAFKVTGGGSIHVPSPNSTDPDATGNGFANYGFNAEPGTPAAGSFNYVNHVVSQNLHVNGPVTDIDVLALTDDGEPATARLSGTCAALMPDCTFSVVVEDNGEPGRDDEFGVTIVAGGQVVEARSQRVVRNGNIQFHSASLSAGTTAPTLRSGQTMRVRGRLRRDRTGTASDAYVVLQLPNGELLSWTTAGLVPGLAPLARNFVPVDWDGDITALPIPAGAAPGVYTWLSALTRAGTLELLSGISARSFTIAP
ncbi:MAG: ice-binding family protein [Vicinamibacterales bacterium]